MKKQLTAVSIVGNVTLLAGLLWMRARHQSELRDVARAAMRGDELHLQLHASSLAALESADSEKDRAIADTLRTIIATGKKNVEARQRVGLGQ